MACHKRLAPLRSTLECKFTQFGFTFFCVYGFKVSGMYIRAMVIAQKDADFAETEYNRVSLQHLVSVCGGMHAAGQSLWLSEKLLLLLVIDG